MKINTMFLTDFYKTIHHLAYVEGLDTLVSYWTPRMSRIEGVDKVVMFGLQATIKKYLIEEFNANFFSRPKEEVVKEYKRLISNTMTAEAANTDFLEELHDLGYLPIQIKAVSEGTRVNIKTPMFEIRSTLKGFGWVVNYLETLISSNVWLPMTSATKAYSYREIVEEYFTKTVDAYSSMQVGPKSEGGYYHHLRGLKPLNSLRSSAVGDFSMRGMGSPESAMSSGAAHLLSFTGTATIPAIVWLEEYYNADVEKEVVGRGVPSTEHSVMSSYGRDGEFECYERLLTEKFPNGNLSIVSDTYDYWNVLTNYIPKLKDIILQRDGKTIIRGDSGNPVDIICGTFDESIEDIRGKNKKEVEQYFRDKVDKALHLGFMYQDTFEYYARINNVYSKITVEMEMDPESNYECTTYEIEYINIEEIELSPEQKGTVELLWETFGGYINNKGYKVLNEHIGTIYGDSITPERAKAIYDRLEKKGFASTNCTLGAGSYSYQYTTRDTLGFALKATHSVVNGEDRQIYKDPITDTGNFKKSQKGMCYVYEKDGDILYEDGLTMNEADKRADNLLNTVFINGELVKNQSLKEIRDRLHNGKF